MLATPHLVRASGYVSELELILALDASDSMFYVNEAHWKIQLDGHLDALKQDRIIEALVVRQVFLRIIVWDDYTPSPKLFFEGQIKSASDLGLVYQILTDLRNMKCTQTICGGTLHHTAIQSALALPQMATRRVLDISTDQTLNANQQPIVDGARGLFQEQGGTINVLAVKLVGLEAEILQGALCTFDGRVFPANTWENYAEAITQKIWSELVS